MVQALRHFIVEVGKAAECPRTGKQLAAARVERLMRHDLAKEEALIVLRLKNIELNAKCASPPTLPLLHASCPV